MRLPLRPLGAMLAAGLVAPLATVPAAGAANDPIYFRDAATPDRPEFYRLISGQVLAVTMPQPVLDFLGALPGDASKALVSVVMTPGLVDQTPYLTETHLRRVTIRPQSDATYAISCDRSVDAVEWTYGQLLATCTLTSRTGGMIWDDDAFAAAKPHLATLLATTVSFTLTGKATRQVTVPAEMLTVHADTALVSDLARASLVRSGLGTITDRGVETTEAVAQAAVVGAMGLDFCGLSDQSGRWDRLAPTDSGHLSDGNDHRYNDVLFGAYDEQKTVCSAVLGAVNGAGERRRYKTLRESLFAAAVTTAIHRDGDGLQVWLNADRDAIDVDVELRPTTSRSEIHDDARDTSYNVDTFLYKQ